MTGPVPPGPVGPPPPPPTPLTPVVTVTPAAAVAPVVPVATQRLLPKWLRWVLIATCLWLLLVVLRMPNPIDTYLGGIPEQVGSFFLQLGLNPDGTISALPVGAAVLLVVVAMVVFWDLSAGRRTK